MKSGSHKPLVILCLALATQTATGDFDHRLLDAILGEHVDSGLVDYATLKKDPRLDAYLQQLADAQLNGLTSVEEQVAFWINAYNAYTLKLIVSHYPLKSIMEIKGQNADSPWDIPLANVAGKAHTLNHLENAILRPVYKDARIHYALVCTARSCPQLRGEAYTAEKLDAQLNEQGRWFMIHRNAFDLKKREAILSKIHEWYAVDFGDHLSDTLASLQPFLAEPAASSIESNPMAWKVSFSEWDWRLNAQK